MNKRIRIIFLISKNERGPTGIPINSFEEVPVACTKKTEETNIVQDGDSHKSLRDITLNITSNKIASDIFLYDGSYFGITDKVPVDGLRTEVTAEEMDGAEFE